MAATWDLLARGGTLVDPGQATEVIDAAGALVTPELIDIHTHVYRGLATSRHAD